jgi:hypothetical protein
VKLPDAHGDVEIRNIIEETRVIIPGLQALFGFQTISVFNERFDQLPEFVKDCHLLGLSMIIIAIGLVMTPAAYYRAVNCQMTHEATRLCGGLIRGALVPLSIGLSLDMFTVVYVTTSTLWVSVCAAIATFTVLAGLWFVLPVRARRRLRH